LEISEQVEVMLAYGQKVIQMRGRGCGFWITDSGIRPLVFNWEKYEYRIKPEPREFWVNPNTMSVWSTEGDDNDCIKVREVIDNGSE